MTDKIGKARALKRGIVRDFQDVRVFQRLRNSSGSVSPQARSTVLPAIVKGVGQQQDLEVRRVAIAIYSALREWGRGVGFNVQMQNAQAHHLRFFLSHVTFRCRG
jgi:hypothetical protein